ncbi:MAG TPA: amino acid adenylation domain-containing protein, partial [Thermoanaerobaculia bacterium]
MIDLLDDCARRGITLSVEGDKLQVRSPQGVLTPELQAELRAHKAEILGRLRRSDASLVPLSRTTRGSEPRPLSVVQQSLWFLHRMDPATLPAYNLRRAFEIEGALDVDRWRAAFRAVAARHETLRSSFDAADEHPVARIAAPLDAQLEVVELTHLDREQQNAEIAQQMEAEGRFAFDVSAAPLFHARLLKLDAERFVFLLNAHHLVADAWSAGVILRELTAIYEGRTLPARDVEYRDYVQWQRERIERGELDSQLDYWTTQLDGLPRLQLPADFAAPVRTTYDGASVAYALPAELTDALRAFSREAGVTLYSTFLAAFAAVLHRYSGQDDFPVGTSIAGRTRKEFEDVVGFFADVLVLRMNVAGAPAFRELAQRVQQVSAEAFEHQDVPFELLVKTLRPERVAGQNPLFQVLFLFLQSDPAFRELQAPSVASKFDLSLHVEDDGTAVRGLVEYKTALFQEETIRAFLDAWMELLRGAMADPARRVDELPLLSRDARHELLVTRNEVRRAELPHATLTEWFEAQAAKTPHRIAATHGSESLTYAELDEKATRLSEVLRARGVGPETRVGLLLERSLDMIVAIVGVLKAGGAYVPLDPADPQSRIDFVRNDSGLEIVVTAGLEVTSTNSPLATNARATVNGQQATQKAAAYIIYTSGSTGQPRGVVVTHENVLRLMRSTEEWFGFGEDDVWAMFHSYAFDFSVWEIWGALLYGGRVVIVPKVTSRSPEAFATLLREEGVTVLNQTPSAFRALIPVAGELPALRYVIFGGEALDLAMLAPWVERNGDDRPRLINMYGITETTVHVTWRRITRADIDANRGSSIGTRIPDLTLYILDEQLEPVPQGVAGQLHVGGAGLARGYHGRAALTAERFVADPFSDVPGARLYRTGDLARWRSATDIEYLGRRDEQLKIRGFRIEPGEIESVLRTHAGVKECVVIAREDTPGQKRLVAYYIPADAALDAAELRALCEKALPAHMIPAGYVAVDAWPRTRNDKLDRAMLPLPDLERASAKRTYAAPRNARERTLAAIWSRVLGVPNVGVDDDFFALGGDSMLSLEVLSQMRKEGLQSSVAQLYQHHRISELAEVVETLTHADAATAPFSLVNEEDRARLPQGLTDAYPLSQLQAGMLYEEQLHQHDALYHDIFSFHLRMPLDEASWMRVLQAEVDRHELLRTSFDLTHFSEPLQLVHAAAAANCVFEDLSPLDADAQERRIAALIDAERDQPFDYAAPPLLRFYLLRRGGDGTQVVFGFHHAILDGWSVALLFSRIVASYLGELKLRPAAAPEALPAVRYADFVALERQALASGEAFWKNELAQLPVTRIPRREDAAGGPRRLARMPVVLPEAVSAGLERTARLAGVPLKTVVLAAHLRVLGALTGQQEVVSGVVTNGRPERPGADRVAGLFLNTLPLRVDLGSGTFLELVQRTFEAERRLLAHRNFPMAAVKQLAGGRPLFDAAFNFIHFHVYQEVLQTEGVELLDYAVWEQTDLPFLPQFSVHPGSSRVELLLVHDGATFTSAQMESIAGAYVRCLTGLAEHPKSAFREQTLFEDERALLESWSGGTSVVESPDAIHRWFEAQVARTPESEAVRFEGEAWTYRELDARANRLAQYLRARGVQRETLVGLCVERSLDLVAGILGILKAGGAYVPLDPAYPADRLRFTIEDSGVPLVVTHS